MRNFKEETNRILAKQGGFYTFEDIVDAVILGRMQSFSLNDTWVVTQVIDFPRKKVLDIVFVIGELEDLIALEDKIEEFRREIQADMLIATGRLGWMRKHFKGWKPVSANFVKV